MGATVELRGRGNPLLRAAVREGYPGLVRALENLERDLPRFVHRELQAYLGCGDPASGFAWLECQGCAIHRLVPFSCKTRGFCPSCAGRRMAVGAAHLVDRVIPWVATRQWVVSVPWTRRWLLARRPDLAQGVLRVALGCIGRWYRRATGESAGQSGSVTVQQRFGSALNLNVHFHVLHLDGVYVKSASGELTFVRAIPSTADVEVLGEEIGRKAERWLSRQGFAGEADDEVEDVDDAQALFQLASVSGRLTTGERAGRGVVRRVQVLGGREVALGPRCAVWEGYNVHANVALRAQDRDGVERLCRYMLRPPLAAERLERLEDGRVRIGFKRAWADGTGAIELSCVGLVEKLAALIPPPRAILVTYSGVLAGHAKLRAEVVPTAPSSSQAAEERRRSLRLVKREARAARTRRGVEAPGWAELLWRVFRVDGWACPACGGAMRLRAVVVRAAATGKILRCLDHARGPPGPAAGIDDRGA